MEVVVSEFAKEKFKEKKLEGKHIKICFGGFR